MVELQFSDHTRALIERMHAHAPHALLLTGPKGIGLGSLATHIATSSGRLLATIAPEQATSRSLPIISTERVRQLYDMTAAHYNGPHFIIIDDADRMNQSAQNALLKLLEEPNPSIHFILTSHTADALLPTILSRTQREQIHPLSTLASNRLLKLLGVTDELVRKKILFLADGLPAEMSRLASNPHNLEARSEMIMQARTFLQGSSYERLVVAHTLKDGRQEALDFIDCALFLLKKSYDAAPATASAVLIEKLMKASAAIQRNGHVKLHLSRAVV